MGCINDNLPIDYVNMKKVIISELEYIVKNEIDHLIDYNDKKRNIKIEKVTKNILNEMKNKFYSDLFIIRMFNKNNCIYKHKRGRREGQFCCKKITENGDKDDFVCTKHNKKHLPKNKNIINKSILNISINSSIGLLNSNIKKDKILIVKKGNNPTVVNNANKIKKSKKINNFEFNKIKNIINIYNRNIICNYKNKDGCKNISKHGFCSYKHICNRLPLKDFINENNVISYNNPIIV